jgi:hypothetical protein
MNLPTTMKIDHNDLKPGCRQGVLFGISALALVLLPACTGSTPGASMAAAPPAAVASVVQLRPRAAAFGAGTPTADVRWLADWIASTRDNGNGAFIVVDKRAAQLHVFDADARWVASSAVLLGATQGDDSVPGIGSRPMALIRESERTTPAGRFVGERGRNTNGEDVVWVDYDAAVSMHRVRLTNPREHRAERLASPSAADNRISYGCINVPVAFYEQHVQTIFARHHGIIYVLPEVRSVQEVFGPYAAALPSASGLRSFAGGRPASIHPAWKQASQ